MSESSHILRRVNFTVSSDPPFSDKFTLPTVLQRSVDDYKNILAGKAEMPRLVDMAAKLIHWQFGNEGYSDLKRPAYDSHPDVRLGCSILRTDDVEYYECIRLIRCNIWFVITVDLRDGRYLWEADDWQLAVCVHTADITLKFNFCDESDGPVFAECSFMDVFEDSKQPEHSGMTIGMASHFIARALYSLSSHALQAKIGSKVDSESPKFCFGDASSFYTC